MSTSEEVLTFRRLIANPLAILSVSFFLGGITGLLLLPYYHGRFNTLTSQWSDYFDLFGFQIDPPKVFTATILVFFLAPVLFASWLALRKRQSPAGPNQEGPFEWGLNVSYAILLALSVPLNLFVCFLYVFAGWGAEGSF